MYFFSGEFTHFIKKIKNKIKIATFSKLLNVIMYFFLKKKKNTENITREVLKTVDN